MGEINDLLSYADGPKCKMYSYWNIYSTADARDPSCVTLPLLERARGGDDRIDPSYDPFSERNVKHPTTDFETFVHLLKGSLGSGIVAMPMAFRNSGLWFGLVSTIIVGFICTYCVHILVKCAHILSYRRHIPMMTYADIAEQAFLDGPAGCRRCSGIARFVVHLFLVIDSLGTCCIYMVFVGANTKQVVDYYYPDDVIGLRVFIALTTVPLILMCLVRNLKYLTPFSLLANVLLFFGITIILNYIMTDLPPISDRESVADVGQWPLFFGTVIFALEGIGVVMPLENDMKTPTHFIGCPSVLSAGMICVITLYSLVGFFGYWKYGNATLGSVTLNLPVDEVLSQAVKLIFSAAVLLTFMLQFYSPAQIIFRGIRYGFKHDKQDTVEYVTRIALVTLCGAIAVALPNLGPFISLIGAVGLSTLGMIVPSIIEMVVNYETSEYGFLNWRLIVDIGMILFGIVGFITGAYTSFIEFQTEFDLNLHSGIAGPTAP